MSKRSLSRPGTLNKAFQVLFIINLILLLLTGGILLLLLLGPYLPMSFMCRTTIVNATNETIYVTGMEGLRGSSSQKYPLTASCWRYLIVPRFHTGAYPVEPGSSITFWYSVDKGHGMGAVLLEDSRGNLHQLNGDALLPIRSW